jgi:hypothetical protein
MRTLHSTLLPLLLSLPSPGCLPAQQPTPPTTRATPPSAPTPAAAVSLHAEFDRILKARVRDGLVDYAGLRTDDAKALQGYLAAMAAVTVDKLPRAEQFAFYVNLYNAAMLQAVLDHTAKDPQWTPAAKEFGVFKEQRVKLHSGTVSLDQIENEILRPRFKDHRVHVAIVCGARSCPPLLPRAYEAADLEAVLDANLKAFLRDTTRNQIGDAKGSKLSKIFEWFQADFGGEQGVRKLLASQFDAKLAAAPITYLDYSWALNSQPPRLAK